jgi:hypothetical protein
MVQFNFARREVSCKLVYYGPGMSGKTTNIEMIHQQAPDAMKGQLTSIATEGDRTLFFDFLPLDLGEIAGMRTKFQLYTVPGQVYYNSTRKLVLQGADGVAFIADSNPAKRQENVDSLKNLEENLREYGVELKSFAHVIQYNKRDVPGAMTVDEMEKEVNLYGVPSNEAVAFKGEGVMPTLKLLAKLVLDRLNEEFAAGRVGASRPIGTPAIAPPKTVTLVPVVEPAAPAAAPKTVALTPVAEPPPAVAVPRAPEKPAAPPPPPVARPAAAAPKFTFAGETDKKSGCKKAAALLVGIVLGGAAGLALLIAALG